MLKVWMVPTLNSAIVHYRMASYVPYMRKKLDVAFAFNSVTHEGTALWELNMNEDMINEWDNMANFSDIIIFQAVKHPLGLSTILAIKEKYPSKMILMEIDDDIFEIPAYSPASEYYKAGSEVEKRLLAQISLSDGIVCSTPFLSKRMDIIGRDSIVVNNGINFNDWKYLSNNKNNSRVRIGWIGAGTHDGDLRIVKDVIPNLLSMYKDIEVYFIGGVSPYFFGMDRVYNKYEWHTIDIYPKVVASYGLDIGIAPLRDLSFNHAKSNLRWLEYSAIGIPSVVSMVDHFVSSIKDCKTGTFATTPYEWISSLSALINNKKLREEMGKNAYNEVRKNWNIETKSKDYINGIKYLYKNFKKGKLRNDNITINFRGFFNGY